jgi:hypothetical protein
MRAGGGRQGTSGVSATRYKGRKLCVRAWIHSAEVRKMSEYGQQSLACAMGTPALLGGLRIRDAR